MIKILVVDDSLVVRTLLRSALEPEEDLEVVATATNGKQAIRRAEEHRPDLVIMDVHMPVMDGITSLEHIREQAPDMPAIIFTSAELDGETAMKVLAMPNTVLLSKGAHRGAGQGKDDEARAVLVARCRQLVRGEAPEPGERRITISPEVADSSRCSVVPTPDAPYRLLCVGSSTGGPDALVRFFSGLPEALPVPVVVAQHMPAEFTRHLAQRLDGCCSVQFAEGRQDDPLRAGLGYVAPGGKHMVVVGTRAAARVGLNSDAPRHACRPAVDPLFESAVEVFRGAILAVVLTGMGSDSTEGAGLIRSAGGRVVVQDEATSVVWGMPGSVFRAGYADEVHSLDELGAVVGEHLLRGPRRAEVLGTPGEPRRSA